MENSNNKGWSANPVNEPTRPMTQHTRDDQRPSQYNRPFQKPEDAHNLSSNDRSSTTAVSEEPESGIKGMLHNFASKLSDSKYGFWLPMLFANRTKVAEGISDVLQKGNISDLLEKTGLKHEWEHNRKSLVTKVAVSTAVAAGVYALVRWNNRRK